MVQSLVNMGALEVFASTIGKFSDNDDLRAVQNIAQMIFEGGGAVATIAGCNSKLINWVLEAITCTKWDAKVCAVGFLNTLLMSSMKNRFQLGQMGIVPVVVNALSSLTSPDEEKTEEEKEQEEEEDLPWTLFGCLFFLLEHLENKVHFVNAGGVKVMIKIIQDEELDDYFCGSAIAALDIVKGCASDKFVNDALELDIAIFPPSMDMIHGSTMHFKAEIEERLISLIESLTGGIAETEKHILSKRFEENDGERITWLMEHFIRYSKKVDAAANHLKKKQLNSSELYKEKLQYGFPTLQSIAVILGYLWSSENIVTTLAARADQ
ncbi:uncharacterized protein LOC113300239 [Papaver somniferum]|uniref:uncharacterized protein LOC113300239 n=1 Tax=Papaver somniferum TaxID=3469 RepID=UPI000E70090E|nr:uncharacterized protein LOC113300239 [Papaver somniferum]XP_026405228.1 uncharacterized protein LOC113300239 [Papaver somniferum]XP_026405229.1 uncharacterized protein LOC113300239 [Papaver somniferum]XP_026405230.1 uncharacterized protein LOC113300239 [Papaver somniferum]XP_026405231.1 uncharacterized protein LOC113300239 [Papaver somniferum]XP_026405233.1 uncharacterized protein LOC113300239 [Papaver somniferum]